MEVSGFLLVELKNNAKYYALKVDGGPQVIHIHNVVYKGLVYPSIPLHPKLYSFGPAIYMYLVGNKAGYKEKGNDVIVRTEELRRITIYEDECVPEWAKTSKKEAEVIVDRKQAALNAEWEENKEKRIQEIIDEAMCYVEFKRKSSLFKRMVYSKARMERFRQFFTTKCNSLIKRFEEAKDKKLFEKKVATCYPDKE
jgi:hypothetical protein